MKKFVTFSSLVWLIVLSVAFSALCWPLVENAWAYYRWTPVPCGLTERRSYFYEYQGVNYIGSRRDFWDRSPSTAEASINNVATDSGLHVAINDQCYVSPSNPASAVLRLDAHRHPEEAVGGFMITILAVAAGVGVTIVVRKKRRKRS